MTTTLCRVCFSLVPEEHLSQHFEFHAMMNRILDNFNTAINLIGERIVLIEKGRGGDAT